jgi:hypothetical protein
LFYLHIQSNTALYIYYFTFTILGTKYTAKYPCDINILINLHKVEKFYKNKNKKSSTKLNVTHAIINKDCLQHKEQKQWTLLLPETLVSIFCVCGEGRIKKNYFLSCHIIEGGHS